MALTNPYTIDEDEGVVRGTHPEPYDVEAVNANLIGNSSVDSVTECTCESPTRDQFVERGDKWRLAFCSACNGLYGWHDIRADYGPF